MFPTCHVFSHTQYATRWYLLPWSRFPDCILYWHLRIVWVLLGAVVAGLFPPSFLWFQPKYIVVVLSLIMGGMGLTLELSDFALAVSKPWIVLIGVLAQYGIMPSLGFVLGRVLKLRPELAVGLILVSVCPGGAASNIVCLIGKADVALSVVLTLCSTVRVVPHRVLCDLFCTGSCILTLIPHLDIVTHL
jgi:predicted Na+-dependent transporter